MNKPKIGAREVVKDVKSGMTDAELMSKYGLSPKGLENLFQKLVQAKLLEESFVRKRGAALTEAKARKKSAESTAPALESSPGGAEVRSELAQTVLQDIKAGQHDNEIMRSHELSPGQLKQIKASLVQSGLLAEAGSRPPRRIETRSCPTCSQKVGVSATECPNCGRWLEPASALGPASAAPIHPTAGVVTREQQRHQEPPDEDQECPWEERENLGTFNAYFQTATKLLLTPTSFFSKLPVSGGYGNSIFFAAMSAPIALVFAFLWKDLLSGAGLPGLGGLIFGAFCMFIGDLIILPITLAIWSGILHLCLYLVGGVTEGYEATFRVVSYSTVTSIFNAVPVVGAVASLWGLVLHVIGLRETHKTTTGKAVAAVAIPVVISAVLTIIVFHAGLATLGFLSRGAPKEACQAVETYIARVDGAADLDADAMKTEVQAAMKDLGNDLKPFQDRPGVHVLEQKAALYGILTIHQAKTGAQLGKRLDQLRKQLRKTCAK
jgi:hypothetical protein